MFAADQWIAQLPVVEYRTPHLSGKCLMRLLCYALLVVPGMNGDGEMLQLESRRREACSAVLAVTGRAA